MSSQSPTETIPTNGSCITTVPGPNNYVPIYDCNALFMYNPSFGAAIFFAVVFGLSTLLHAYQARRYAKRFCWVIIMAGAWETAGFSIRAAATRDQTQLALFMPEEMLILLAPLWVNAFIYMLFGRMVYYYLPERKVWGFPANRLAVVFVCMDIVSFLIQGAGGTIASGSQNADASIVMVGIHVYMGGVGLQQLFILCFTALLAKFHRRLLQIDHAHGLFEKSNWRPLIYATYACLAFITIRIIYRLVQYSSGVESYIPTHEWFVYVFEALPMALALWLLNSIHPGRFLVGDDSEFPPRPADSHGVWWYLCCCWCCCWCCRRKREKKSNGDELITAGERDTYNLTSVDRYRTEVV